MPNVNTEKIILIHGWGCDSSIFNDFVSYLKSDVHCINYYNKPNFEDFIINEITKHKPCHVIAWSLGGMVIINNWQNIKDSISKLSLISVPLQFCGAINQSKERLDQMIESLESNPKRELKRFWRSAGVRGWKPDSTNLNTSWLKAGLDYLGAFNATNSAKNINIFTNIIQSDNDLICLKQAGNDLHKNMHKSVFHEISDAGHAPFLDKPKLISQLLLATNKGEC